MALAEKNMDMDKVLCLEQITLEALNLVKGMGGPADKWEDEDKFDVASAISALIPTYISNPIQDWQLLFDAPASDTAIAAKFVVEYKAEGGSLPMEKETGPDLVSRIKRNGPLFRLFCALTIKIYDAHQTPKNKCTARGRKDALGTSIVEKYYHHKVRSANRAIWNRRLWTDKSDKVVSSALRHAHVGFRKHHSVDIFFVDESEDEGFVASLEQLENDVEFCSPDVKAEFYKEKVERLEIKLEQKKKEVKEDEKKIIEFKAEQKKQAKLAAVDKEAKISIRNLNSAFGDQTEVAMTCFKSFLGCMEKAKGLVKPDQSPTDYVIEILRKNRDAIKLGASATASVDYSVASEGPVPPGKSVELMEQDEDRADKNANVIVELKEKPAFGAEGNIEDGVEVSTFLGIESSAIPLGCVYLDEYGQTLPAITVAMTESDITYSEQYHQPTPLPTSTPCDQHAIDQSSDVQEMETSDGEDVGKNGDGVSDSESELDKDNNGDGDGELEQDGAGNGQDDEKERDEGEDDEKEEDEDDEEGADDDDAEDDEDEEEEGERERDLSQILKQGPGYLH